ncbi:Protein STRUBBELIG-RECEPTOR FAMILY 8 [Capsicum baccatum]|uniref:Protein STRUBBELIG-RECEPTOR FAMILY 8 n=1 Tax=Capsicum baccatum TaxID=33114 RepID=A0A2G2V9P0_CAPBA|nr:Protein STRUBBELIG-RECEPTOR FAMILY 8 [Capsicum baccatum]
MENDNWIIVGEGTDKLEVKEDDECFYWQHLLLYDHVTNGSLHDVLYFANDRSELLTWNAQVKVYLGTARALEYLHEVCLHFVVHRNFKSTNILLDKELNLHLLDCGLAALTPNIKCQASASSPMENGDASLCRLFSPWRGKNKKATPLRERQRGEARRGGDKGEARRGGDKGDAF